MSSLILRAGTTRRRPTRIIYIDTETERRKAGRRTEEHVFRLGVGCRVWRRSATAPWREEWATFRDPVKMVRWIDDHTRPRRVTYLVASNPGFDLWVLDAYRRLARMGWRPDFLYDRRLTYILKARKDTATLIVLAVQNFWPVSIATLGEWLGIPKEIGGWHAKDPLVLQVYCRRDVTILRAATERWLAWLDEEDIAPWAWSAPGTALKAYLSRWAPCPLVAHGDEQIRALEREAYIAGRTEAGMVGDLSGPLWVELDCNSAYPAAMRDAWYPVSLLTARRRATVEELAWMVGRYCVVAEVEIQTEEPIWPVRGDGGVIFPVGRYRAVLPTGSVVEALRRAAVRRVGRVVLYRRAKPFTGWVDHWYARRLEARHAGDPIREAACKILLNSLYGKFGQRAPHILDEGTCPPDRLMASEGAVAGGGAPVRQYAMMGRWWIEYGLEELARGMPSLAAHVTDYARLRLWRVLERVGRPLVAIVGVDNVIVPAGVLGRLEGILDPERLGAWKEVRRSVQLHVWGPRDYLFGDRRVVAGIEGAARALGDHRWEVEHWPGTKALLGTAEPGCYPVTRRRKRLRPRVGCGYVEPSGRVVPWRLDEGLDDHGGEGRALA